MKDICELVEQLFETRLHLSCDYWKVVEEIMEALDILLARHGNLGRLGTRSLPLLCDPALAYARDEDGWADLVLLPDANQGSRYEVEEPLSRFENVGVEYNIVEHLGLSKRFETCEIVST